MPDYSKEAKKARKEGDFLKAGDMFQLAGKLEDALDMYLKGNHYSSAGRLLEQQEDFKTAARYYAQAENYSRAGEISARLQEYKTASTMFEKANDYARASEMAEKSGDLLRAASLAERANQPERAANIYTHAHEYERAVAIYSELFERFREGNSAEFLESHQIARRKYASATAALHSRIGNFERAASYYEAAENLPRAAESYARAENFEKAASVYAQMEDFRMAAEMLEKCGRIFKASEYAERAGDMERAATLAERAGQFERAANLFIQSENYSRAADITFKLLIQAIDQRGKSSNESTRATVKKLGNASGNLYYRLKNLKKAAWCFEQAENYPKAAECYVQADMHVKAGELFFKAGNNEKACELLLPRAAEIQDKEMLADLCYHTGKFLEAADLYSASGNMARAADAYIEAGQIYKAALLKEELKEYTDAAGLYEKLEEWRKAAQMYEKAEEFTTAAKMYELAGMDTLAMELYTKTSDRIKVAEMLIKQERNKEAIGVLQQIPKSDRQYNSAALKLAKLFREAGLLAPASQKLTEILGSAKVSTDNLEEFYDLAVVYQEMQLNSKAAELFEQILAVQFDYKDSLDRLQTVRSKEGEGSPSIQERPSEVRRILNQFEMTGNQIPRVLKPEKELHKTREEYLSLVGRKIREYEILEMIGRGGMGAVYRARHVYLDKQRAIKVVHSQSSNTDFAERFVREAKILSDLDDPHLVQLYEFGIIDQDFFFMVMELIQGESVKERLKRLKRLDIEQALNIVRQAGFGLLSAHKKGVVHRDISPDNLMLVKDDAGEEITKVIDFGIAKPLSEETQNYTSTNMFIGKPEYASPEQCGFLKAGETIDHRTDIYSLATTLVVMLTGATPFSSPTPQGYLVKHVTQKPKTLRELAPDLTFPPQLEQVIGHALSTKRDKRPSSMAEFLQFLDAVPV